jgi:hypothetical protein
MSQIHHLGGSDPQRVVGTTPLLSFEKIVMDFLAELSSRLLQGRESADKPGLKALGFWLRARSLQSLEKQSVLPENCLRKPAGLVFHIAPSNVDLLFAYSWAISLLLGNCNIVRLSSRAGEESALLLQQLQQLLSHQEYHMIAERNAFISYEHDDAITAELSQHAQRRVIWGSDESVRHLRSLPASSLCQDIVFPDRISAVLLSSAALRDSTSLEPLLEAFYRDSYGFNQKACSSPRLLLWLQDGNVEEAATCFWQQFAEYVAQRHPPLGDAELMDKRAALQSMVVEANVRPRHLPYPFTDVVRLEKPDVEIEALHCGGGLFLEGIIDGLDELGQWLHPRYQTLTYWGVERDALTTCFARTSSCLPDRTVPVGQALDFDVIWDGMNLFERLSRVVRVR